jgi:thiol-disulfide isomerase/thioredoxin
MKKIKIVVLAVFAVLAVAAQPANTKLTVISGTNERGVKIPVILYSVKSGEMTQYATTTLNGNNQFAFALPDCKPGFYYLTDTVKWRYTRIYLKPGDKLDITLRDKGEYVINIGSEENKLLEKWWNFSGDVGRQAQTAYDISTFKTYFPLYESFIPKAKAFKKQIATQDKKFNQIMKETVDYDMDAWLVSFLITPHPAHPTANDYPAFLKEMMDREKFDNASILRYGDAVLNMYRFFTANFGMVNKLPAMNAYQFFQKSMDAIANDTLKGAYLLDHVQRYSAYKPFKSITDQYKQFILTPDLKAKYYASLKRINAFGSGSAAYNFEYEDATGKKVSLESLKGKVVVLDLWATWCGPCKEQIPHLQKLEEEIKAVGKDGEVAFVSISTNVAKEKQQWLDMIKTKSMDGIQLWTKGERDLMDYYSVETIPRFMVIDKEGNIVSVNAPRPSTPELKAMILKTLEPAAAQAPAQKPA